jgi:hypothetical protein
LFVVCSFPRNIFIIFIIAVRGLLRHGPMVRVHRRLPYSLVPLGFSLFGFFQELS